MKGKKPYLTFCRQYHAHISDFKFVLTHIVERHKADQIFVSLQGDMGTMTYIELQQESLYKFLMRLADADAEHYKDVEKSQRCDDRYVHRL